MFYRRRTLGTATPQTAMGGGGTSGGAPPGDGSQLGFGPSSSLPSSLQNGPRMQGGGMHAPIPQSTLPPSSMSHANDISGGAGAWHTTQQQQQQQQQQHHHHSNPSTMDSRYAATPNPRSSFVTHAPAPFAAPLPRTKQTGYVGTAAHMNSQPSQPQLQQQQQQVPQNRRSYAGPYTESAPGASPKYQQYPQQERQHPPQPPPTHHHHYHHQQQPSYMESRASPNIGPNAPAGYGNRATTHIRTSPYSRPGSQIGKAPNGNYAGGAPSSYEKTTTAGYYTANYPPQYSEMSNSSMNPPNPTANLTHQQWQGGSFTGSEDRANTAESLSNVGEISGHSYRPSSSVGQNFQPRYAPPVSNGGSSVQYRSGLASNQFGFTPVSSSFSSSSAQSEYVPSSMAYTPAETTRYPPAAQSKSNWNAANSHTLPSQAAPVAAPTTSNNAAPIGTPAPFVADERALRVMKSCLQLALKEFPNESMCKKRNRKRPQPGDVPPWKTGTNHPASSDGPATGHAASLKSTHGKETVLSSAVIHNEASQDEQAIADRHSKSLVRGPQRFHSGYSLGGSERPTHGAAKRKRRRDLIEDVDDLLFGGDVESLSDAASVSSIYGRLPVHGPQEEWEKLLLSEEPTVTAKTQKAFAMGPQEEWEKLLFDGELSPAKSECSVSTGNDSPVPLRHAGVFTKFTIENPLAKNRASGYDDDGDDGSDDSTTLKKSYLRAGLYAIDYKMSEDDAQISKKRQLQNDESTEVFPMACHFGDWYMKQEVDFQLPYDIALMVENNLLVPIREPPRFVKVRSNIYVERKRRHDESPPECHCVLPADGSDGCNEECFNRCLLYECSPKTCPCGERCSNQSFAKKDYIKELEVAFISDQKGFGLKTVVPIPRQRLVTEYRGEVITMDTARERMNTVYRNHRKFYFLDYSNGEVIDGTIKGTDARYVNHSCDPNCFIEKWHVDGEVCIGLFSLRDIAAGEELTYDYNFQTFSEKKEECLCGSDNCRGFIVRASEGREAQKQLVIKEKERLAKQKAKKKTEAITRELLADNDHFHSRPSVKPQYPPPTVSVFRQHKIQKPTMVRNRGWEYVTLQKKRENFDMKFIHKNKGFVHQSRVFMLRSFHWVVAHNQQMRRMSLLTKSRSAPDQKVMVQRAPRISMMEVVQRLSAKIDGNQGENDVVM